MMFLGLRKLGNICGGHKMFLNNIKHFFVSGTQILCPQHMLRARANGETFVSATMCPQQCVLVCQGLYGLRPRLWLLIKIITVLSDDLINHKKKQNCFSGFLFISLYKALGCSSRVNMHWYFDLKETAVELCTASCSLVLAYHEARKRNGKMDEEVLSVYDK